MKYIAIASMAAFGVIAAGRPASAQSRPPDFDLTLLSLAAPGSQLGTAASEAVEGVETPDGVEVPEAEGPEGVEGPDTPGDMGPNVDHQFEGEETGENGTGGRGSVSRG